MWNRQKLTIVILLLTLHFKNLRFGLIRRYYYELFIGMLFLRTLGVHALDAVEASILSQVITLIILISVH